MGTRKSTRSRAARAEVDEEFAEEVSEKVRNAPALLEVAQIASIEAKFRSEGARTRQSASMILSITGAELMERVATDRNFAVIAADLERSLDSYEKWLREYLDTILGAAQARLMIALAQRPDMTEVIKEAETGERKVIQFPRRVEVDRA